MSKIVETYTNNHSTSAELFQRSKGHFPDGVTHDGRYLDPFPVYMSEANGTLKLDVDGNRYVDYVMGHGALILGHAHPKMVAAVGEQARKGTHLGGNTELELDWAELVKTLMPYIEKVRFHSSGTEAVSMALRLARAYTQRPLIVKFERHFHGWHDAVVVEPGKYSPAGIPDGMREATVRLNPLDTTALEETLAAGTVAAVIVEPTGAQMGSYPLPRDFLSYLRDITTRNRCLLIFDEVVTGFRVSKGGAAVRYGVEPDLCTLGKILGGGLPGAASAGKREVMDLIAHRQDSVWNTSSRIGHPGTFNANPLSAAAGISCLSTLISEPVNQRADSAAVRLKEGINSVLSRGGVAGFAHSISSIVKVVFGVERPNSDEELYTLHGEIATAADPEVARYYRIAMLNHGVDTMGGGRFIVSGVHSDGDIDATIDAFERSVTDLRRENVLP